MAKAMVNLVVDGNAVSVPAGTLIVDAAKQAGVSIPVFCYHPKMEPVGMCRLCLVEVGRPVIDRASGQPVMENGTSKIAFAPKLETACTTPVSEGMQVVTASENAQAGRKDILEFLLTSHPLDCPVCDKGGECPLQDLTIKHGSSESRFIFDDKQRQAKHVPLGDLIWLDRERCIQCARCIRFQDEIAGDPVLAFYQRGRVTDIVTYSEPGFNSVFSGNTTDICPVGALTTADFRFGARPWEMEPVASICPHCPVGCNITLNIRREARSNGRMVVKRVMPRQNELVNEIWMCDKGRFAHHYTSSAERLSMPLVKKDGQQVVNCWDEALHHAGNALAEAEKDVLVVAGGRLSNEDLFNLKALAVGMGGEARLYSQMGGGRFTIQAGLHGDTNFGEMGPETCFVVASSDLYDEAPIWYLRIKQAVERGAILVVVAARPTQLEKYASHVVRHAYGDEAIAFSNLDATLAGKSASQAISASQNLVILFGSDGLGMEGSAALAQAGYHLLKKTGHLGKQSSGLVGAWQQSNEQGAWELGFETEKDLAGAFKDKVVLLAGCDPAGDDPALATALKSARFVIVQELFPTATAQLADVVLPASAFTERDGSLTSGERRVQRYYAAVPAFGESRPDFSITASLAEKAGIKLEGDSASKVMDQVVATLPTFSKADYQHLAEVKKQMPLVGDGDLYYGGSVYQNKQGLGIQLEPSPKLELPAPTSETGTRPTDKTLLAIPITKLFDQGITVKTSTLLAAHIGAASLVLHPDTAKRYKLDPSVNVQVSLGGVDYHLGVVLDENVPASVALLPRSMGIPLHSPEVIDLKVV